MFGYVRPVLDRLSGEQRDAYQSAYCGLCHALGRRCGFWARFTLQYDFTFLAILLAAGESCETECRRCPAHPIRKPRACVKGDALDLAADESMILTWHKLCDDVADHSFLTGLPARFLRLAFRGAYRKAATARPQFDGRVRDGLARLDQLEKARSPELDRVADVFASLLSAAADSLPDGHPNRRPMEQLLYHLGRWIYLADAWDDLEEDEKKDRYNPLAARFPEGAREQRDYFETTLTHSARLAASAANLMELGEWSPIVENVIYLGLPAVQKAVLEGRWRELQKTKTRRAPDARSL